MATRADIEKRIAEVATGDRAAFRALYSDTSAKLFGVVLRILGDRALAEDALQDVYIKIWKKADRYRANGLSPMTWLITIARNHAIDLLRRRRDTSGSDDLIAAMPDPGPTPEGLVIRASENARLDTCLGTLDQNHSEAVRRAYLVGDTYAELATHFDVPLNTMRTWLRRSLLKLRECLSS